MHGWDDLRRPSALTLNPNDTRQKLKLRPQKALNLYMAHMLFQAISKTRSHKPGSTSCHVALHSRGMS